MHSTSLTGRTQSSIRDSAVALDVAVQVILDHGVTLARLLRRTLTEPTRGSARTLLSITYG